MDMCAGVPQLSVKIGALKQTAKRAKAKGSRGRAAKRKSARAAKRAARASDKHGAASEVGRRDGGAAGRVSGAEADGSAHTSAGEGTLLLLSDVAGLILDLLLTR